LNCSAPSCAAMHPDSKNASRTVNDCMTQSGSCITCFRDDSGGAGPRRCFSSGDPGVPAPVAAKLWSQLTTKSGLGVGMLVRPLGGRSCAEPDGCVGVTVAGGDCVCS
jgi:hypothetical protein